MRKILPRRPPLHPELHVRRRPRLRRRHTVGLQRIRAIRPVRIDVPPHKLLLHLQPPTRGRWQHPVPVPHHQRVLKHPSLQEFQILQPPPLTPKPRLVKDRHRPHQLPQPNPPAMRTHRHAELRRHRHNREQLVHPAHARPVNLAMRQPAPGQQLLKRHRVRSLLSPGHAHPHRCQRLPQLRIPHHIVVSNGFFNEQQLILRQLQHVTRRVLPISQILIRVRQ